MTSQTKDSPEWLYWPTSWNKQLALILFVAILYYSTGSIGLLLSIPNTNVSTVWPPSGIALAAGLIYGYKIAPAIFLGSFINNIVSFFGSSSPVDHLTLTLVSIGIGIGSVLQMWAGLAGIHLFIKNKDILGSATNVFKFLIIGIVSCLVNSNIGTYSLALGGVIPWEEYRRIFFNWWLGDTAGIFVFTPFIWAWIKYPFPKMTLGKSLEAITLILCLLITFFLLINTRFHFLFILLPLMVWGGVRFSHQGATLMVVLTSIIAIWGTWHGIAFYGKETANISIIVLQSVIAITTVMTLSLGALVEERVRAFAQLKDINQNLELKIQERTREIQSTLEQLRGMQEQIIAQQKLASLGELTAGIAHEIKNPLNFINNFADLSIKQANKLLDFFEQHKGLHNTEEMETIKKLLDIIISNVIKIGQHGKRADGIVQGMLSHARADDLDFQTIDLNTNIKETVKQFYSVKQARDPTLNISFDFTLDPSIKKVTLIPQEFNRVIMNLLDNAFYAVEKQKERLGDQFLPKISVFTKNIDKNRVSILIRDNGTGIPPLNKSKIFTPFFTTKPPGEGTGLGLSLSRDVIVNAHHGELRMNSKEGEYTEFLIILPKKH
jgi:signal transduction histidine kinase